MIDGGWTGEVISLPPPAFRQKCRWCSPSNAGASAGEGGERPSDLLNGARPRRVSYGRHPPPGGGGALRLRIREEGRPEFALENFLSP